MKNKSGKLNHFFGTCCRWLEIGCRPARLPFSLSLALSSGVWGSLNSLSEI